MLFRRVGGAGGRRLNLSSNDAWLLHPQTKPDSYIKLLPKIMESIRAGSVPPGQCGNSELNLAAWEKFLSD